MTGTHKSNHSSSHSTSSHYHNRNYSQGYRNGGSYRQYQNHGYGQQPGYGSYPRGGYRQFAYRPSAIHIVIRPPTQPQFPNYNALALMNSLIGALLGGAANRPSNNLTFTGNPKFDEQILNYLGAQKPITAQSNGVNSTNTNATNTRIRNLFNTLLSNNTNTQTNTQTTNTLTSTSFLQALQTFGVRNDQLADLLKPQNATQIAKILSDGGFPISTQQVNQFITEITSANQPTTNTTSSTVFNAGAATNTGTASNKTISTPEAVAAALQSLGVTNEQLGQIITAGGNSSGQVITQALTQAGFTVSTQTVNQFISQLMTVANPTNALTAGNNTLATSGTTTSTGNNVFNTTGTATTGNNTFGTTGAVTTGNNVFNTGTATTGNNTFGTTGTATTGNNVFNTGTATTGNNTFGTTSTVGTGNNAGAATNIGTASNKTISTPEAVATALQSLGITNEQLGQIITAGGNSSGQVITQALTQAGFTVSSQIVNQFISQLMTVANPTNAPIVSNNTLANSGTTTSTGNHVFNTTGTVTTGNNTLGTTNTVTTGNNVFNTTGTVTTGNNTSSTGTTSGSNINLQQLLQGTGLSSQDLNTLLQSVSPEQLTGLLAQSGLSMSTSEVTNLLGQLGLSAGNTASTTAASSNTSQQVSSSAAFSPSLGGQPNVGNTSNSFFNTTRNVYS